MHCGVTVVKSLVREYSIYYKFVKIIEEGGGGRGEGWWTGIEVGSCIEYAINVVVVLVVVSVSITTVH